MQNLLPDLFFPSFQKTSSSNQDLFVLIYSLEGKGGRITGAHFSEYKTLNLKKRLNVKISFTNQNLFALLHSQKGKSGRIGEDPRSFFRTCHPLGQGKIGTLDKCFYQRNFISPPLLRCCTRLMNLYFFYWICDISVHLIC